MSDTKNLANGGWITPTDETDMTECNCGTCGRDCPCQNIDCDDDECDQPRGCFDTCTCDGITNGSC